MPGRRREHVIIAGTATGLVPMRVSKAVALKDGDGLSAFMVLDEPDGDRHLVIGVGDAEAFALAASLQGLQWGRPMTYQFAAALVRSLGGQVREVRLDRIVEGAYAATVEVVGPQGAGLVDARSSDALNIAVLTQAPVYVAPEMLADCIGRQQADSVRIAIALRAGADPVAVRDQLAVIDGITVETTWSSGRRWPACCGLGSTVAAVKTSRPAWKPSNGPYPVIAAPHAAAVIGASSTAATSTRSGRGR